jgi:type I restriction enzyme S subunit
MSRFTKHLIGELIEKGKAHLQTGPFGTMLNASEYSKKGVPVIAVQDIGENVLRHHKLVFVPQEVAERLSRYKVKEGDIIFGRKGAVERRALIKKQEAGWLQGSDCIRLRLDDSIDSTFVAYQLGDKYHREWLTQFATGATMPSLNQDILKLLPVFLPELPEQQAIAEVLSSFDDKMDLLHRQNKTLEALAETLFRQCFVEEAEESWEEVPLPDFFDFLEGPGIRNWQYTDSGTPFINIRLIIDGEIDVSKANFVSNEEAMGKYKHFLLQEDDMIVSTSGTLGKTAVVRNYHLPLMLNTSVIRFRPKDGKSYSFIYQYLKSRTFQDHLEATASGSVQANFGPTHLKQMKFPLPSKEALNKYLSQADSIYEKIKRNFIQVRTLTTLRDTLLPKLMSGEVRVNINEAETAIAS